MIQKQKAVPENRQTPAHKGRERKVGHSGDEHLRDDRGGQVGSGDAREQADQEEFDRGGHRDGRNRNQAR